MARLKAKSYPDKIAKQMADALNEMNASTAYMAELGYVLSLNQYSHEWRKVADPIAHAEQVIKNTRARATLLHRSVKLWKEKGY